MFSHCTMKVKVIERSDDEFLRDRISDPHKVWHDKRPQAHPHAKEREFQRAVNAAKLDKMFSKPFVGALDGHSDGVWCTAKSPTSLAAFLSGACDGEVRVWHLAHRRTLWSVKAHDGFVRGLCVSSDGRFFYSCGDDKTVKQWSLVVAKPTGYGGGGNDGVGWGAAVRDWEARGDGDDEDDVGAGGAGGGAGAGVSHEAGGGGGGAFKRRKKKRGKHRFGIEDGLAGPVIGRVDGSRGYVTRAGDVVQRDGFLPGRAQHGAGSRLPGGLSKRKGPYGRFEGEAQPDTMARARAEYRGKRAFTGMDHHWGRDEFATSGAAVELWSAGRTDAPLASFAWGVDTTTCVAYNPAEACLLASAAQDRNVCLYDVRAKTPVRKVVLSMRTNALAWNPMEPMNFTCANEDHNCYTFDMRKLARASMVHKDHVGAVMDVSYSPTGQEFATASYDRTVRIFSANVSGGRLGRSRACYHSRRMQRVFTVEFSPDARFVLSGSDDTNVRIWKARANDKLGAMGAREKRKRRYDAALVRRYQHVEEVRRIVHHTHVPRAIVKEGKKQRLIRDAARARDERRRRHEAKTVGAKKPESVRQKAIVKELE